MSFKKCRFYGITFFNNIFQVVCIFSVFTYFWLIFVIWWGRVPLVVDGFSETLVLISPYFVNGLVSTNLYSCLSMKPLYFLHSLHFLEKLKEWYTFKSCIEERFWFLKRLKIWKKRKMIRYVSSGSVLSLLRN